MNTPLISLWHLATSSDFLEHALATLSCLQRLGYSARDCELHRITCTLCPRHSSTSLGSALALKTTCNYTKRPWMCVCVSTQDTLKAFLWLPVLRCVLTSSFWLSEPRLPVRGKIANLIIFWRKLCWRSEEKCNRGRKKKKPEARTRI